jgi:hypothetical protein
MRLWLAADLPDGDFLAHLLELNHGRTRHLTPKATPA